MQLSGKTVLITGALGGLGSDLVEMFHKEKAKLILTDIHNTNIPNYFQADLSNRKEVMMLAKGVGFVDILINNAGVGFYKTIDNISYEEWDKALNINLNAPMILMKEMKPAVTINIGSGCSIRPRKNRVEYNTTKNALRTLSLSVALDGNKVVYFNLGSMLTNFGPLSKDDRKKRCKKTGKCYLNTKDVANFLIKNLKDDNLKPEWNMHPKGYLS